MGKDGEYPELGKITSTISKHGELFLLISYTSFSGSPSKALFLKYVLEERNMVCLYTKMTLKIKKNSIS